MKKAICAFCVRYHNFILKYLGGGAGKGAGQD